MTHMPRFTRWIGLVAALWLVSCATVPTEEYIVPGTTTFVVSALEIRGVESFPLREIKAGLATQEDPGWRAGRVVTHIPFLGAERRFYNYFDWRRDIDRILIYYYRRGYFNAQVLTESVFEDPENESVRIRLVIDEGEPTQVRSVTMEGVDLIDPIVRKGLLEDQPLREGAVFREEDYLRTRDALGGRLRRAGHAFAQVSGRVFVYPDEDAADVIFFTDPGPETVFGTVFIVGLEDVEERFVRQALPFAPGDRYNPNVLIETQMDIYDLRVFGLVTVLPAHEARDFARDFPVEAAELRDIIIDDPDAAPPIEDIAEKALREAYEAEPKEDPPIPMVDRPLPEADGAPPPLGISRFLVGAQEEAEQRARLPDEVPVVIRLKEAKKYNIRVGTGLSLENTRQDVRLLLNWSARNFLGGLRRLDHFNTLGYAWAPGLFFAPDVINQGIVLSSELRFSQPQFIERRTNFRTRARIERDVREGFSVWNPSLRLGVDRPFWRFLIVDASYNVSYFNYSNVDGGLFDIADTALGLDFRTEFFLEFLEQSIALDFRDDVLDPSRGFLMRVTVQEAGRYLLGGEFDFIKPIFSAEGYVPFDFFTRTILAARLRLGSVYNVGRDTDVPIQNRLYSGGTDGMRGMGRRRLSLYTPTGDAIPVGGLTQFEWAIEPRVMLVPQLAGVGDFWGAIFLDSATVLAGQFLYDTEVNRHGVEGWSDLTNTLVYAMGLGVWWVTPVGPIRADAAYTITDIANDLRFRRCVNPQDYATPECDFVPVEDDPIQTLISGYSFFVSVGHSF
ncbi:MAG: outer membrane protein assembly factor [Bradymonadaceae bacterium]